jgi:hypothetical protein
LRAVIVVLLRRSIFGLLEVNCTWTEGYLTDKTIHFSPLSLFQDPPTIAAARQKSADFKVQLPSANVPMIVTQLPTTKVGMEVPLSSALSLSLSESEDVSHLHVFEKERISSRFTNRAQTQQYETLHSLLDADSSVSSAGSDDHYDEVQEPPSFSRVVTSRTNGFGRMSSDLTAAPWDPQLELPEDFSPNPSMPITNPKINVRRASSDGVALQASASLLAELEDQRDGNPNEDDRANSEILRSKSPRAAMNWGKARKFKSVTSLFKVRL